MKKFKIERMSNGGMERRDSMLQNIEMADGTEHNTTQHSTSNSQINNTNPITHREQTLNIIGHDLHSDTVRNTFNYQHQSNTVNKTYDASATPISTVMTDTDVAVDVSINVARKVSQTDSSNKVATSKQFVRNKSQSLTELNSISMSALEVSSCTSVNEHGKTDSDQNPKSKFERSHSCKDCSMSFILRNDLTRHIRTHTGERPFSCEDCNKSFTLKGNLKRHILTHIGNKPYTCTACPTKFVRKDTLKKHEERKHKNYTNMTNDSSKASQNHTNRHIASIEQPNKPQSLTESNFHKHASEKDSKLISAMNVLLCTSVNKNELDLKLERKII